MKTIRLLLTTLLTALTFTVTAQAQSPLELTYTVTPAGGGLFNYEFTLTLSNNGPWTAGQNVNLIIFGDAPSGTSPLTSFVFNPVNLPVSGMNGTGSSGGHNGPTLLDTGPGLIGWVPTARGDFISWSGTSTANLSSLLFSNLIGTLEKANFKEANLVPSTVPEIAVFDGIVTDPQLTDNTGTQDFVTVNVGGSSAAQTFTIRNDGTADLTGIAVTKAVTGNPGDFTVNTAGMLTTLVPNATTTFTVTFSPTALGARSAVVEIASNDEDENPFEINVSGTGKQQKVVIGGNFTSAISQALTDLGVSFINRVGSLAIDPAQDGLGAGDIILYGFDGGSGPYFDYTTFLNNGGNVFVAGGSNLDVYRTWASLYFNLTDTGSGWHTDGPWTRTTVIPQSAGLPATYTFQNNFVTYHMLGFAPTPNTITYGQNGEGVAVAAIRSYANGGSMHYMALHVGNLSLQTNTDYTTFTRPLIQAALVASAAPPAVPEIAVANSLAVDILDTGSQAFGTTEVGLDLFQTFTVSNSGTGPLSLGAITFDGSHPSDFIVSTAPALASVPGPGSTTFTVRFRPLGAGTRSAVMHIVNGDADESPFDITLSGTGQAPEIVVHDGSHALALELTDGQGGSVNFGGTAPNVASIRNFLVRNTGDAPLDITTITVPSGYLTNGAATTLAPGTSYGFQVALESSTPATYAGSITINSDDLNEAAFDFPVTGSVVAPGSAPVVNVGGEVAVQGTTGSAVLGGPVGSTLYSFVGSPALNSSGVLASAVQIRHADASLHTGMMVGQPMVLIATDTQIAPSLPGVTYYSFGPPVLNETGQVAFTAEVRGAGITKNVNSRCLFSNASDGLLKLVAQVGTATTLGSNLKTIGNFSIGGDLVIFLGTLVDNRSVLFGWDANSGIRPLMRTGQSLDANGTTKTVKSFNILETGNASSGHGKEISVAPTGESLVTINVTFTDNSSGVVLGSFDGTSDTGFGQTYGASQQLADTYAAPAVIPLAKWSTFRSPGFDNTGNFYGFISQMVTNTLAGVTSTNNVGLFVDTAPGNLTLQLRENDVATGTGGLVFSDFSDLVLGGGDYEFLVKGELRGSGVVTNVNSAGLWAQHATNGLVLVAREGSEAPGVAGSTFFRLTQLALPGTAQPLFQASMKTGVGGVTTANDTGLWVINEANEVKLAVREGDVLNVGGTDRTVTAITALLNGTTTGGALGRRVFLADGQLTLLLTFSGGIQANAKVVVP